MVTKMTNNEQAIAILKREFSECKDTISVYAKKRKKAFDIAIKALEQISHLIDRPCEACEFRKDNGCCKWDCVFEEDKE